MKKILFFTVLISLGISAHAQVVLNLQLPPLGLTIKPQLWNLSLINTSAQDMQVRIEMVMTDVRNNQRVLTGTSKLILLPKGIKQVQLNDVLPITYNSGSPGYAVDPSPEGFLPIGLFNICYTAIRVESDAVDRLGEECETIEIEPISPPQLMMPLDEEQVEITRPFFAWIPPSPFNTLNSLLYDWVLVEVQPTQSPADALQQNVPVLSRQNIAYTNFQYPLSSPELDSSKLYAWRITARNNLAPIGNSEVWSFRVRRFGLDSNITKAGGSYFSKLSRTEDAAYAICNGVLRFEYLNEFNEPQVEVAIFDLSDAGRKQVQLDSASLPVQFGQNFQQMDLRRNNDLKDKHMYLLELVNARREKWYLKFEYRE
ncbi:hypothetical protein D3H65_24410 [Paraflavitalea soli]|uniref:DUF928 domain-containing protein n=1 Tax=Paraflavitalea soli TaxID=2315862 RepID=A0A3B7MSV2_9BACT|nr:hypothetical protein [Paraflavitalea soli]AXY76937.1 hypothetical protein D3H65_24410 [Paraflavitalea soli]